jgi:hypothetical protein
MPVPGNGIVARGAEFSLERGRVLAQLLNFGSPPIRTFTQCPVLEDGPVALLAQRGCLLARLTELNRQRGHRLGELRSTRIVELLRRLIVGSCQRVARTATRTPSACRPGTSPASCPGTSLPVVASRIMASRYEPRAGRRQETSGLSI